MPRISFKHEDNQQPFGFQEGNVHILYSRAVAFQFPPNKTTKEQSDAFPALVWRGVKCDADWNDTEEEFEVIIRMLGFDKFHIGKIEPKDFDNQAVDAADLGVAVGTEGNTFAPQGAVSLPRDWGRMEESLRKQGFKPEIAARGITTDFEGCKLHLATETGKPYIGQKGKNKGKEVTPTYFICDRIHTFGYDVKKEGGKAVGTSGEAGPSGVDLVIKILQSPSAALTTATKGKTLKRDDFRKALVQECMRTGLKTPQQKVVIGAVQSDDALMEIAAAVMDAATAFTIEGEGAELKVQFC